MRSSSGRWRYLPIGGHTSIGQFHPAFTDAIGEDQRTALDDDGVTEPAGNVRGHRKCDFYAVADIPSAFDTGKKARHRRRSDLPILASVALAYPCQYAEQRRKTPRRIRVDSETHGAMEWIPGLFHNSEPAETRTLLDGLRSACQLSGCLLLAVSRRCGRGRWRTAAGTAPDESWLQNDLLSMFGGSWQLVIPVLE